jgi:hypothetical protein
MNRKIFIISAFCFLLSAFSLSAQDTWVKSYAPFGSSNLENYTVRNIAICQDGGYAVNGTYIYDDSPYIIFEFGFLMKTDSEGNFLWVKQDTVSFIERTESLAFVETDDCGFISAFTNSTIGGGNALIKRDSEGNREWVVDNGEFQVWSMAKTSDGNIVLSGILSLGLPAIRKITPNGAELWTQTYNPNNSRETGRLYSIIETLDGGLAATGYIQGNGLDLYVLKADADGDTLWTRTYDGYGYGDYGNSIIEDNFSNFMSVGKVWDFGTIGFIWFIDSYGNTIWNVEVDSNVGYEQYSVIKAENNNFIAYCHSPVRSKMYSFDSEYNIEWESDLPFYYCAKGDKGVQKINNEGFICAGASYGRENIQIAKTDTEGNYTSIEEEFIYSYSNQIKCYPNPFNPITNINFSLKYSLDHISFSIYNVKGQRIRDLYKTDLLTLGEYTFQWDGRNFNNQNVSSGIYYVILESKNQIIGSKKIIMLK